MIMLTVLVVSFFARASFLNKRHHDSPRPHPTQQRVEKTRATQSTNNNNPKTCESGMSADNQLMGVRRDREDDDAHGSGSPSNPHALEQITSTVRSGHPVITIVLTGGPCAGKSTSLVAIATEVQRRTAFKVFCVPEAATLMVTGGLEWNDMTFERTVAYQLALLRTQLALEDNFKALAHACGRPAVVLCDRGTMDGRSYCTTEQWDAICQRGGYQTSDLRDNRYDAVLHMVTAAFGAEKCYNLDNPARYESLEGAREADLRLRQQYVGHPRIRLIDNKPGAHFQRKINEAVDFVFQCLGHTPPRHDKRRFLLRWPSDRKVPVPHEEVSVKATVLAKSTASSYSVAMLRRSGGSSTRIYLVTSHEAANPDVRSQQQLYLTDNEYSLLTDQCHPAHVPLEKRNHVFELHGAFYDLAVHISPPWIKGYATLYVDGLQPDAALPEFLSDATETTNHEQMSSFHQSRTEAAAEVATMLSSVAGAPGQ